MIWMPDGIYSTNLNKLNLPYHFDQTITKHSFYILCLISSCVCLYIPLYSTRHTNITACKSTFVLYIQGTMDTLYQATHTHPPPPPPTPHIWDSKDSRSWDCNHIQCHCNYTLMCCTVQIVYSEFKYYLISKYERNNVIDAIFLILQTAILEKLSERTICVFQKSLKNIVYMCSVYI